MTSVESEVASFHLFLEKKNKIKLSLEALFILFLVAQSGLAHAKLLYGLGPWGPHQVRLSKRTRRKRLGRISCDTALWSGAGMTTRHFLSSEMS